MRKSYYRYRRDTVMPEACAGKSARWELQVINPKAHSLKEVKELEKGNPQKSSNKGLSVSFCTNVLGTRV